MVMKCIRSTHNGKAVFGAECVSFIYQTTPQFYISYVTEHESEHFWQDCVTNCTKLLKFSCFNYKNLYRRYHHFWLKKEEIWNLACWLQRLGNKDYLIWMDQTVYTKFCFYGWQENVVFFEQNKKVVNRWPQQHYDTENSVIFLSYFIPV